MHVLLLLCVDFGIRRIYSSISMEAHAAHIIFFPIKHGKQFAKVIMMKCQKSWSITDTSQSPALE